MTLAKIYVLSGQMIHINKLSHFVSGCPGVETTELKNWFFWQSPPCVLEESPLSLLPSTLVIFLGERNLFRIQHLLT